MERDDKLEIYKLADLSGADFTVTSEYVKEHSISLTSSVEYAPSKKSDITFDNLFD